MDRQKFVTYENRINPHICIHKNDCKQIRKNGGEGEGLYKEFYSYNEAYKYAETTNLEIRDCSFCLTRK